MVYSPFSKLAMPCRSTRKNGNEGEEDFLLVRIDFDYYRRGFIILVLYAGNSSIWPFR